MGDMDKQFGKTQAIAAARRGQIIQHVMVDGWSAGQAARAFGLEERRVAAWVADYRRYGLASLRREETSIEGLYHWFMARLHSSLLIVCGRLRGVKVQARPATCVVLRRTGDDARTGP